MSGRAKGRLSAAELAEAAVLGDVALVLGIAGWVLPAGIVFLAAATVPFAALAVRCRLRAVLIATGASYSVAALLAGPEFGVNFVLVALLGLSIGLAYRRGWRRPGTIVTAWLWAYLPLIVFQEIVFYFLTEARHLTLEQIDIGTRWMRHLLDKLGFEGAAAWANHAVELMYEYWWLALPIVGIIFITWAALVCRLIAAPALRRLDEAFARPGPAERPADNNGDRPGPVPTVLRDVRFRYPGAAADALDGIDLEVRPGALVAVVGDNGSGKSTLARIIAGRAPTSGQVDRPGAPGAGRVGGTAVVFQRPESQVLGIRVRDDVVWGLPPELHGEVDVDALLAQVGLAGFADRETATLSGGELQRLALAAALARRPALLVSDESTAMLDPEGRRQVTGVLRRLADDGLAVVHVTHHPDEAAIADEVVVLAHGRVSADEARTP